MSTDSTMSQDLKQGCVESRASSVASRGKRDADADEARRVDTSLSVRDAFRYYWKAMAWSVTMSMSTVMESYDMLLINSLLAFPTFKEAFGVQLPDGSWSIPAKWQVALTIVVQGGLIVGTLSNGSLVDRFGFKKVMFSAHVVLAALIFINFFAQSIQVLVAGTFLL